MVRPKTSRNGNSKRNRTSYQEEKVNAKLRDYDILGKDGRFPKLLALRSNVYYLCILQPIV